MLPLTKDMKSSDTCRWTTMHSPSNATDLHPHVQVDNNNGLDYTLPLTGALTEDQVLAGRVAAYEAQDAARTRDIDAAEAELWARVQAQAREASESAMRAFREKCVDEMRAEAQARVAKLLDRPTNPGAPSKVVVRTDSSHFLDIDSSDSRCKSELNQNTA